jgi:GNAT superfamily N-acetyltransferase
MEAAVERSMRVKSFDLTARDIAEVDVNLLHALTLAVGWPHRPRDLDFMRRVGNGIVAVDGIGRVFGSAMWFPLDERLATLGLFITTPRMQSQGSGRWLIRQVLERCGGRDLTLNATRPSHPLYRSLGFVDEATLYQYRGIAAAALPPLPLLDGELQALPAVRLREILELDRQAFGADRSVLLAALAEDASAYVLLRGGTPVGYSLRHEFGRGHVVGPVVAANDQDAVHLTAVHLQALAGRFARVDTREGPGAYLDLLHAAGLGLDDTYMTMSHGRAFLTQVAGEPRVYGLAAHAFG